MIFVPATDQRRDAETALQRAARAAAERICIVLAVDCGEITGYWPVEQDMETMMAAIIYQTIRDAREI